VITNQTIDEDPDVLGARIGRLLATTKLRGDDIRRLQNQLLARHSDLRLKQVISSEEVVEGFFRCALVHHLQERYQLPIESLPCCINSSHRAVRRLCTEPRAHRHQAIADDAWAEGWRRLQRERGVNIVVPNHRSPRRADLYLLARDKVVSVEFKYIGPLGLRDAALCAAQIRLHAANHALAFLLLYCGADIEVGDQAVARLNRDVGGNVRILAVHGPAIPVAKLAAQHGLQPSAAGEIMSRRG
jgi:hypothetical protein